MIFRGGEVAVGAPLRCSLLVSHKPYVK